jgi:hypothetical protein
MQASGQQAVASAAKAEKDGVRSNLLNSMLAKTTQPISFPTRPSGNVTGSGQSTGKPVATDFNNALNKIIGG